MNDADRAQALIEEEARIDALAAKWQARFDRWENSQDCSPSASDLAIDAMVAEPEIFEGCDDGSMAQFIDDLLIDGQDLTDVATGLIEYAETFK